MWFGICPVRAQGSRAKGSKSLITCDWPASPSPWSVSLHSSAGQHSTAPDQLGPTLPAAICALWERVQLRSQRPQGGPEGAAQRVVPGTRARVPTAQEASCSLGDRKATQPSGEGKWEVA